MNDPPELRSRCGDSFNSVARRIKGVGFAVKVALYADRKVDPAGVHPVAVEQVALDGVKKVVDRAFSVSINSAFQRFKT